MKRYTVGAYKEYETQFGMIEQEQVYAESFLHSTKAEKKAEELYKEGGYCGIYIGFNHQSASAYWNPNEGMNSTGANWISHFENQKEED